MKEIAKLKCLPLLRALLLMGKQAILTDICVNILFSASMNEAPGSITVYNPLDKVLSSPQTGYLRTIMAKLEVIQLSYHILMNFW